MMQLLEFYWPLLLVALAIGLSVAWLVFRANRKTRVTVDRRDVLDEGAAPAARNQALIDAGEKPTAQNPTAAQTTQRADGDDLTQIKGLGDKIAQLLAQLGVTRFAQIAAWDDAEIDRIDAQLDRFQGRIRRDNWVEQAKLLAAHDKAGFDAKFGNS